LIGEELTIEGEITSEEEVVVQGTVRGSLSSTDAIQILSGAVVESRH